MRAIVLISITSLVLAASAGLLGGCALVAGYDFGRYGERTGEGGASASSSSDGSVTAAATASSTGAGGADASSSGTGGAPMTTVLYTGAAPPIALSVDAAAVYFTTGNLGMTDGTLWRVEKDGTNPKPLVSNQPFPDSLALDSMLKYAYWVSTSGGKGTIRRVSSDGGGIPELIFMPMERVGGLAFSSGTIYWTATESGYVFEDSAGKGLNFIVSGQSFPGPIVTDGSSLYWVDSGANEASNGLVMKADLGGKGATALANGLNSPAQIAVSTSSVYWCTVDGGVYGVLKNGTGDPHVYVKPKTPANPCSSLAADELNVYFAQGSTVYRELVGSIQATAHVTDLKAPLKIALDQSALYVAGIDTAGKGTVIKASK